MSESIFVYGTLLPGEMRWPLLARCVADTGTADAAVGQLFDTSLGYPAAVFGADANGLIVGRTFVLRDDRLATSLAELDIEEGTDDGLYERISISTNAGREAWTYTALGKLPLSPIESGDWLNRA